MLIERILIWLRDGCVHIHIMYPSTCKGKENTSPILHASASFTHGPGDDTEVVVIKREVKKRRKFRLDPEELLLFSDPLDGTSSDDQSFDEEDMCGSDSDVETISLGFRSSDQMQSSINQSVVCLILSDYLVQEHLHVTCNPGW
jgi:hypothetical protein